MRGTLLALLVASAAAFVVFEAVAAEDEEVRRGQGIAQARCARCHAIGPDGASPHAQAPPFRELSSRYPVGDLEEALAEGMLTGHPDMPEFVFQPHEIGDFLAYLESLPKRR